MVLSPLSKLALALALVGAGCAESKQPPPATLYKMIAQKPVKQSCPALPATVYAAASIGEPPPALFGSNGPGEKVVIEGMRRDLIRKDLALKEAIRTHEACR